MYFYRHRMDAYASYGNDETPLPNGRIALGTSHLLPSSSKQPLDQSSPRKQFYNMSPKFSYIFPSDSKEIPELDLSKPTPAQILGPIKPYPIEESKVLELARKEIRRQWPNVFINACPSRPGPKHPNADRYWVISSDDPVADFGPCMGEERLARIYRGAHRSWRPLEVSAGNMWRKLRRGCMQDDSGGGSYHQYPTSSAFDGYHHHHNHHHQQQQIHGHRRTKRADAWMPNMAERKWLLNLLSNQIYFRIPQPWQDHIRIWEAAPSNPDEWDGETSDSPWILIESPKHRLCISIQDAGVAGRTSAVEGGRRVSEIFCR